MAPFTRVSIRTRGASAAWDDTLYGKLKFRDIVLLGLESDGYIVLTLDDSISLAAQNAQLAFDDLVNGRRSAGHDRFLKRLQNKTLLEDRPFESSFLSKVTRSFSAIADAVLRMCLSALGMPSNALASFLDDPEPEPNIGTASLLQAISYSGHESLAAEAHIDRGLLTVVWEDMAGLQVCSPAGDWQHVCPAGEWQPVTVGVNQVVVFAGEMLQHATAGRIPAAVHRVLLEPTSAAPDVVPSSARVSLAFKQRPAKHAVIDLRNVPGFRPDSRWPHPLVVSQATALFEAKHPSIHQPSAGAQHQEAEQLQGCKRNRTSRETLRIFAKTLTGKTITLDLDEGATVQDMAEIIRQKEGIPPYQQRLIHGRECITPYSSRTLADLNIQAGAIMHLVLKIYGD